MNFPARTLAGLLVFASSVTFAFAQGTPPLNAQVEIDYVRPQKREFLPIHDRLKNCKVLEQLQQFLSPLRLPKKLTIKIDQCGADSRPFKDGVATICYEIVEKIERAASGLKGDDRSSAIAGAFIQATMYQVSVAIFDILDFPIWGRAGDAADRLSAFVMQNFGEDLAVRTLIGTSKVLQCHQEDLDRQRICFGGTLRRNSAFTTIFVLPSAVRRIRSAFWSPAAKTSIRFCRSRAPGDAPKSTSRCGRHST